jgi:hypothetical protein
MITKTEVKPIDKDEIRIIFYTDGDESYGYKLPKRIAGELYAQLREEFKNDEL